VLPRASRLTAGEGFRRATRHGRRAGTPTLVLHLVEEPREDVCRVGFVVGRSVGPAVTRNRVRRRLRHLVRDRLDRLPGQAVLVVRALPAAATADSRDLAADLDAALTRVLSPAVSGSRP